MIRGETAGLSDSGPYGIIQPAAATNNFFDQQGAAAAYFGELEAALMQGVVGIRNEEESKALPTLDIFPSWPMRFQQSNYKGSSGSGDSSDSGGSAQNTNTNTNSQLESEEGNKDISEQNSVTEQEMLNNNSMMMMVASNASRVGAEATNHQEHTTQDKRRMAGSATRKDGKPLDAKTLRRLAQNREAARKSRLRKKAYVQQLESSRMKLTQLEQDLQRARSQGLLLGSNAGASISPGAAMFDMEYARWLDENYRHMAELQGGLQVQLPDGDLRIIVDDCLSHYDDIFRMKSIAAKSDVFHLINGMWKSPAERCFLWIGGFKPSDLLKILMAQLDLLTEQQLLAICNLQQSSQQAEEALSQGYEQLQQSLANAVASGALNEGANVGNFMGHMAMALGKIAHLEGFVQQADNLRRQTLHQLRRILTIRQAAKCFLAIGEYYSRLRALSSLWASRPQESMIIEESSCPTTANNLQMVHQPANSHFSAF